MPIPAVIAEPLRSLAVPIDSLNPDPSNARRHPEKNLEAIRSSLALFGQRKPIVVQREGMIVRAGNGTLAAAKALGWETIAAVILDDDNATAVQFAIADNRSGELAEWDDEVLASLLDGMDPDTIDALAFDEEDMRELMAGLAPDTEQDEVPDPPANPVTKLGDLIILGDHRLICGDSTGETVVARLLDGATPFLMVTDPPYGVSYDPTWRDGLGFKDPVLRGKVNNDDRADWTDAWDLFHGVVAYVWHSALHSSEVAQNLIASKFDIRAQIIWRKQMAPMTRGHYRWQHEPCWYAARGSSKWCGDHTASTIWDIDNLNAVGRKGKATADDEKVGHGTQKPIECMARPIRNHGSKEDDVYDPFLGSGTTLIAAEQLGRRCYGIEIDPAYCDVIVQRWENLTGKKAQRP